MGVTPSSPPEWDTQEPTQGQTPEWIFTPKSAFKLAPGDAIVITLSNIKTKLPCGQANLYVRYENIPGYWDGERVVTVTKTAIMCNTDGRVGIGTVAPPVKLTVVTTGASTDQQPHVQLRREKAEQNRGPILFLELFQDDDDPKDTDPQRVREVHPSIRFHHRFYFWSRIEARLDGIYFLWGDFGQDGHVDIHAGQTYFSATAAHLQLRREKLEKSGGSIPYLELFQDDDATPAVPEVHPNIRFNHGNRFWCRIEAQSDPTGPPPYRGAFHFKDGPIPSDTYVDVYANSGHFVGSVTASSFVGSVTASSITVGTSNFIVPLQIPNSTQEALKILGQRGGALFTEDCEALIWKTDALDETKGYVQVNGTLYVNGTLSVTGDKQFTIDHPDKPGHELVHACLEGPESAVYYRGESRLRDGRATVRLPGYFESLTRNEGRTVMLTAKGREPFLLSYEDVVEDAFRVYGTKAEGEFAWEVKAVRADVGPLEVEVRRKEDGQA